MVAVISRTTRGRVVLRAVNAEDPRLTQQATERAVDQLQSSRGRFAVIYRKDTADGAAATATSEKLVFQNAEGFDRAVERVTLTPLAKVDKAAADYATIRIWKRLVDGGDDSALALGAAGRRRVQYPLAELSTRGTTCQMLRATPFVFTGPTILRSGELLTLDIAKFGLGVIVPISLITLWLVDA